jgi:glycosyltransferase involved in cell wall biosynthesis
MTNAKMAKSGLTIGVWFGFDYKIAGGEGIVRFLYSFITSLMDFEPTIHLEVWAYEVNKDFLENPNNFPSYPGRIEFHYVAVPLPKMTWLMYIKAVLRKIIPMKYWLAVRKWAIRHPMVNPIPITPNQPYCPTPAFTDSLIIETNSQSQADIFLITHLYGTRNAVFLNKPKVVVLYDLFTMEFADYFALTDPFVSIDNDLFLKAVKQIPENEIFFVCHSEHIRTNHGKRYINNLSDDNSAVVYLPMPKFTSDAELDEQLFRKKYGIKGDYIVYPTQFRPYKNFETVFRAFSELRKTHSNIRLVLTCRNRAEIPESFFDLLTLSDIEAICFTKYIAEEDFSSLYKYAKCGLSASLAEGGLPFPFLESARAGIPVVVAKISVVLERLEWLGINPQESGILFFDPYDYIDMAKKIQQALDNPSSGILSKKVFDAIMSRTWCDVAREYMTIFHLMCKDSKND